MDALPDVNALAALTREQWAALGDRLRNQGVTPASMDELRPIGLRVYERLQTPVLVAAARTRDDHAARLMRAFCLDDAVPRDAMSAALGAELLAALESAGVLLARGAEGVVSPFRLHVYPDLHIVCDEHTLGGEAVFGGGPGTEVLLRARPPSGRSGVALDLGCGAGASTLAMARRAGLVVATDINPRAAVFLRANMAINGIDNIELHIGDGFSPVEGRAFDSIVSQPPFVPRPRESDDAQFRFGGPLGPELVLELLADAPRHLRPGGRATFVFELPVGHELLTTPARRSDERLRTLVLVGNAVPADAYSIRHGTNHLARGLGAFDDATATMRQHLREIGIRALHPVVCVMERPRSGRGWSEVVTMSSDPWRGSEGLIARLLAGLSAIEEAVDGVPNAYLELPRDFLLIRRGQDARASVHIGLPPDHATDLVELTPEEWQLLREFDSEARAGGHPIAAMIDDAKRGLARAVVGKLVRAGVGLTVIGN